MASSRYGTSSKLTMKPELSFAATGSLPRAFLSSRSSVTASTTMSHVFRSAVVVVKRRRLRVASRSAAASFPFSTNLASDFSIPARALSQTCWDTSRTVVSYPAAAATWAIPLPMSPEPSTPTRLMSVMALPRSPGIDQCADLVCDAEERIRLFARQSVPGFNLPALEPVQHLLQPDLDVLVLRTVAAKNRSGRRSEDQERQERERREQPHHPKGAVPVPAAPDRSEEHTSELQSRLHLVCRLLLEKKNQNTPHTREWRNIRRYPRYH